MDTQTHSSAHAKHQNQALTTRELPQLFTLDGASTDGVAITAYGQGQLSGAVYTVPAHGELEVDFTVRILCVTPKDERTLSALIRSLLDASHQHSYDDLEKTQVTGGASLFGFFSAGISASYSDTKHTMDRWGLSETNQEQIVSSMMDLVQKTNEFSYRGIIYNREYDYSVSGSLFGIVMDATIQQSSKHNQVRFIAPHVHLNSPNGPTLPIVGKLYS